MRYSNAWLRCKRKCTSCGSNWSAANPTSTCGVSGKSCATSISPRCSSSRQLERAWDTYKRLEADLQSQQRLLAAQFPDLAEAPANTDELLDELQRLQDSLSAQRRELTAALTALQKRGVELVNEWEQFVKERERWRELRRTIDADFAVFERADEEGHRYLAAYNSTKAALELQLAQARQELDARARGAVGAGAAAGSLSRTRSAI